MKVKQVNIQATIHLNTLANLLASLQVESLHFSANCQILDLLTDNLPHHHVSYIEDLY